MYIKYINASRNLDWSLAFAQIAKQNLFKENLSTAEPKVYKNPKKNHLKTQLILKTKNPFWEWVCMLKKQVPWEFIRLH